MPPTNRRTPRFGRRFDPYDRRTVARTDASSIHDEFRSSPPVRSTSSTLPLPPTPSRGSKRFRTPDEWSANPRPARFPRVDPEPPPFVARALPDRRRWIEKRVVRRRGPAPTRPRIAERPPVPLHPRVPSPRPPLAGKNGTAQTVRGNTLTKLRKIVVELRAAGYRFPAGLSKAPKPVLVDAIERALAGGKPNVPMRRIPPLEKAIAKADVVTREASPSKLRVVNIRGELTRAAAAGYRLPPGLAKLPKARLVELLRNARRGTIAAANARPLVAPPRRPPPEVVQVASPSKLRVVNIRDELKRAAAAGYRVPPGIAKMPKARLVEILRNARRR